MIGKRILSHCRVLIFRLERCSGSSLLSLEPDFDFLSHAASSSSREKRLDWKWLLMDWESLGRTKHSIQVFPQPFRTELRDNGPSPQSVYGRTNDQHIANLVDGSFFFLRRMQHAFSIFYSQQVSSVSSPVIRIHRFIHALNWG